MRILILCTLVVIALQIRPTIPANAIGTTLPMVTSSSPYRIFNDLFKQSSSWLIYIYQSGKYNRYYNFNPTLGPDMYPTNLIYNSTTNYVACSQISLYTGIDQPLIGTTFTVTFNGNGTVGVTQSGNNSFNVTSSTSPFTFNLGNINNTLNVWIYSTNPQNLVNQISILPVNSTGVFTSNFLNYVNAFQIIRFAYWQGQALQKSGISLQIWANRTTPQSASQVIQGIALEHILQLQNITGIIPWLCLPDTADNNYISSMATFMSTNRNPNKLFYLQYGNAYTLMNDVPDILTNPKFDLFMSTFGYQYRTSILFVTNYNNIQFYLNALGNSRQVNYTYIDAIGMESSFGFIDATNCYGLNDTQFKSVIIQQELAQEVFVNEAFQQIAMNGLPLISYSGGPYIKTPQFGWVFNYNVQHNTSAATLAQQQTVLAPIAQNLNYDPWIAELYLDWLQRLQNIGFKTIMFSRLVEAWTTNRADVPLLDNLTGYLNPGYTAIIQAITNHRLSAFAPYGTVPSNSFVCTPSCVWGDCINNACVCYESVSGVACDQILPRSATEQNKIGMNLAGILDYNAELPFVDVMRNGRAWVCGFIGGSWSSCQNNISQISFDANNYPLALPIGFSITTICTRDLLTHYDQGTYVILYDGDGILTITQYDIIAVRRWVGRIQVDVVPSTNMNNGILITIERTNPSNRIRNIRVIRPGFEPLFNAVTFHPMFLSKIKPFKTLRFMGWYNINSQTDTNWTTRVTPAIRSYALQGVALQEIVKLGNLMAKDIWINVPHMATQDYIANMSQYVYNNLRPDVKVYVEYSNEVWGTLYPGANYAQSQGLLLNLSSDPTTARFAFYSLITQNISKTFRSTFNNSARLQIVVSTQSVNPSTTQRIIQYANTYSYIDGVAVAPYFSSTSINSQTMDTLMNTDLPSQLQTISSYLKQHLNYTNQYNLKLLCYQSGQSLTSNNNNALYAQSDSRMYNIYLQYYYILFNNSITLANHFCDVSAWQNSGSWGLWNFADQFNTQSIKWNATQQYFLQQNLDVATNLAVYGVCNNNCSGNGFCSFGMCICYSEWTGSSCQTAKYIYYYQCGFYCTFNHGTCQQAYTIGINRYFNCSCYAGWTGAYCGIPICSNNCNYNGTCIAPGVCQCFNGKTSSSKNGSDCLVDCGCNGHGVCGPNNTCICDSGYNYNITTNRCEFACGNSSSSNCYGPNLYNCNPSCVNGFCQNATCSCFNGWTGSVCNISGSSSYINNFTGINVAGLSYWSTQHLFMNLFYQSSSWIPVYYPGYYNDTIAYTWDTGVPYPITPNGYPTQLRSDQIVVKLLLRNVQLKYPNSLNNNTYVLLYSGDGLIQLGMDATIVTQYPGRIVFTVIPSVNPNNGIYVQLMNTNPSNPVHNIRVMLIQHEYRYQNQLLTDSFMNFLNQFSTIRVSDLMSINSNNISNWGVGNLIDQDTQATPYGLNTTLLIQLLNRSGKNAWINIPHLATDSYVTSFAQALLNGLTPGKTLYIEYSNEVWNTLFPQGNYAIAQANLLNMSNAHAFYGYRSLQIFNIFKSVFAGSSFTIQNVISAQSVNIWTAQQIFSNNPGLVGVANILAIAPYYDCNQIGNTTNAAYYAALNSVDAIIQACENNLGELDSILQPYVAFAANYSLKLTSYEAGPSIVEVQAQISGYDTPGLTNLFIAANQDPRMQDIYTKILSKMYSYGLNTQVPNMIFSSIGLPSKYGSWGILDYSDQVSMTPTHPKFQALLNWNPSPF